MSNDPTQPAANLTLKLSVNEVNLILEGLGYLPYARVYELVNKVQSQAYSQLNPGDEGSPVNGGDNGT